MEVDPFPLEKDLFPQPPIRSPPESRKKNQGLSSSSVAFGPSNSFSVTLKQKYDDLSEESPEEGESQD